VDWLALPVPELNAFSTMLPILQAREHIGLSDVIAVGTGSLKKETAQGIMRDWKLAANARARAETVKRSPAILGSMGIKVG